MYKYPVNVNIYMNKHTPLRVKRRFMHDIPRSSKAFIHH